MSWYYQFTILSIGTVHYIDDKGRCSQAFIADGPIKTLLYCEGKDVLVAVTDGLILTQHNVNKDGSTTEFMKVHISCNKTKNC